MFLGNDISKKCKIIQRNCNVMNVFYKKTSNLANNNMHGRVNVSIINTANMEISTLSTNYDSFLTTSYHGKSYPKVLATCARVCIV